MHTCARTLRNNFCSLFPFSVKEAKPLVYIKAIVHGVGPLMGPVKLLKGGAYLCEPRVIVLLFEHSLDTILFSTDTGRHPLT